MAKIDDLPVNVECTFDGERRWYPEDVVAQIKANAERHLEGGTYALFIHTNGDQCIWLTPDNIWFVPFDAGGEGEPCPHEHPTDALQQRLDAVSEMLPRECWVTQNDVLFCTDFIGGKIGNGEWTFTMCCLPCQIKAALRGKNP